MSNIYGRQVIVLAANKSGGSVVAGDVVIIDTANDTAFTTTTSARVEVSVGVAQEAIANNATGRVLVSGYAGLVNVPASVTRGHYIETHTVAKQATGNSTRRSGSFGQFFTGGTTPTGWLWGQTDQTASGGSGALVLLEQHTASASSSLDFTTFISATYDDYVIRGIGIVPATNTASLLLEVGTGAGPTYDTGNNYEWVSFGYRSDGVGLTTNIAATGIAKIFNSMSNTAAYGFGVFVLNASDLQSTAIRKSFHGTSQFVNSAPANIFSTLGIQWITSGTAATGLRFIMSSGNITSGTIRIYGVSKS